LTPNHFYGKIKRKGSDNMKAEIVIRLTHDMDIDSADVIQLARELQPMFEIMATAEMRENVMQKLIQDGWESPQVEVEFI
jgi:hypothetical protein